MKRIDEIIKKQSVKPDDIDFILSVYDEHIKGAESETYRQCKCPGSLRIIMDDIMIWRKKIKQN